MNLFRGYVRLNGKKSIDKFKNVQSKDLLSLDEAKEHHEYGGVLNEDAVLIDVDDKEQAELLFKICEDKNIRCKINETSRGMHFFFRRGGIDKCATHKKSAAGIICDYKAGNVACYAKLKSDGVERETIYDIFEDEEYQEVPKWLYPINTSMSFLNMEEGDGRDSALYGYILVLQSNDFNNEEIIECLHIINDYLLKDKMSENDMERILRSEAFAKQLFFKNGKFQFNDFAIFLKNNHNIIRINNQLHLYKDGIYVSGQSEIESAMISHIPQLNKSKRSEVMAYLDILIRENTEPSPAHLIAFRNGLFSVLDDTFFPFSSEHVITNRIEWDFNENAYWEQTDEVLNNIACGDAEIRSLLEEMIGYCLFRRNELGKAFVLTGSGSNGKSTFLDMVKNMLGKRNLSVLDLKKLNDRFSTVMLFGKLANIGDDISDEFITDAAEFKKIVTGQTIDAEQKGQPKFDFEPYVKLIFSANSIPRIGKGRDSSAIIRRLIIIPFNAKFDSSDPNYKPFIADTLKGQESMEYLIQLGIKGLKRVLENRNFTSSQKVQEELNEFEESNNPVLGFFRECENEGFEIENEPTNIVYKRYQEYCLANSLTAMSAGEFSKQVKKHFDFAIISKKIQGKTYRIFVKG